MQTKLTPWGLDVLLATHLSGTDLYEKLLSRVRLAPNEGGDLPDFVIDNVKSIIKVVLRMTVKTDDAAYHKFKQSLVALLDFGTIEGSDNIRAFLASDESKVPTVLTTSTGNPFDLKIEKSVQQFVDEENRDLNDAQFDMFSMLIQQTKQDFAAA